MMPHQYAIKTGVIRPKYPAAPRQWTSTFPEPPSAGGLPPVNTSTGVRRDFSGQWPGEERFPLLDATLRAASIGAIGYAISRSLKDSREEYEGGVGVDGPEPPKFPPAPTGASGRTNQKTSTDLVFDDIAEGEIVEPLDLPSGGRQQPPGPRTLRPGSIGALDPAQESLAAIGAGPASLEPAGARLDPMFSYPGAIDARAERVPVGQKAQGQSPFRGFPSVIASTAGLAVGKDTPISSPVSPALERQRKRSRKSGIAPSALSRIRKELGDLGLGGQ